MPGPLHTVVETESFLSKATKIMTDDERTAIVNVVAADPTVGDLIKGTGGLRKLRIPLEGRGKRGGARVIYWFHSERYPAVLPWVFAKNERPDLTDKQRKALAAATAAFLDGAGD